VGTPDFLIGEVAGLKVIFLGFDAFIYNRISYCTAKHCARTEEWAVQAPGLAEDEAGLFDQSVGISYFTLFVVEKPGSEAQLALSLHPAHLCCGFLSIIKAQLPVEPSCKKERIRSLSLTPDGLCSLGVITRGYVVMWHGGETCSGWMDELCSSVVVLLLLLRVTAAVKVTRGKLFCSPYNLQVKRLTLVMCQSSEN